MKQFDPIRNRQTMLRLAASLAAALSLAMCASAPAIGQSTPLSTGIDLNVGLGGGRTAGDYRSKSVLLMAAEIQAVAVLHEKPASSIVVGLSAGMETTGGVDDMCVLRPDGSCVPHFPSFALLGLVLGWENKDATTRVSTGPVYAIAEDGQALGWSARWDGALPLFLHLSLTASLRGVLIPDYREDAFQLYAIGVGVRLR